jgi:hypothetical protein
MKMTGRARLIGRRALDRLALGERLGHGYGVGGPHGMTTAG